MILNPFTKIARLEREKAQLERELSEARAKLAAGGRARGRKERERVLAVAATLKRQIAGRLL